MADKESTPPSKATKDSQSPSTPNPKRARMTSPDHSEPNDVEKGVEKDVEAANNLFKEESQGTDNVAGAGLTLEQLVAEEDDLEADNSDSDSAFVSDTSDTTSISSSIYAGYVENGRRYQNLREGEYWGPSDEKQFESMHAAHVVYRILDSEQENPLFRSPISKTAQNILDVGTGSGVWAVEVADMLPQTFVQGVDLSPPPDTWVPPNCKFEVDDVLKKWMFAEKGKFDLIFMRDLFGSFTDRQWTGVYKQAFENLVPGGWIEQFEPDMTARCDDGTLPVDSVLAQSGALYHRGAEKMGKPLDAIDKMKDRIAAAGFINVHDKLYKVPMGDWVKNPLLKEAGRCFKSQLLTGMEGYSMFLFTHFGDPTPWTAEEVQVWLASLRKDVENTKYHSYYLKRRVWAQKPFDEPRNEEKAKVDNVA